MMVYPGEQNKYHLTAVYQNNIVFSVPTNLSDVSMYPNLIAELLSRGWTESEIKKVASQNIVRVFKKVEQVAKASVGMPDESAIPDEDLKPNNTCRSTDDVWN